MSSKPSSKVRDSCDACAVSKVKCPKERPSCSRCEIRGTSCRYLLTRRPGRKKDTGIRHPSSDKGIAANSDPKQNSIFVDVSGLETVPQSPLVGSGFLPPSAAPPTTLPQAGAGSSGGGSASGSISSSSDNSDNNGYLTPTGLSMTLPEPDTDNASATTSPGVLSALGEFISSPLDDPMDFSAEISGIEFTSFMAGTDFSYGLPGLHGTGDTQGRSCDIASLLMPADIDSMSLNYDVSEPKTETPAGVDLLSASGLSLIARASTQTAKTSNTNATAVFDRSLCDCLTRALDLLKGLSCPQQPQTPHSASAVGSGTGILPIIWWPRMCFWTISSA